MTKMWMVRAGQGASYVEEFIENNFVAIGWGGTWSSYQK